MARVRGRAFLDTGRAEVCAVASRHLETARDCATELGCQTYYDDFRRLADVRPDAVLIEVPHRPQDDVAFWALNAGFHTLIAGCLASSVEVAERIADLASRTGLVVEAGYQRRYDPAWEDARKLVGQGTLGEPIMAVTMGLWRPDPLTWYYDQNASGGMPLTHLSYLHMNAIRWIMGAPRFVHAVANQKVETGSARVREESCGVLVGMDGGAFISATASYAGPEGMPDAEPRIICASGGLVLEPRDEAGVGLVVVSQQGRREKLRFEQEPSPTVQQAECFLDAIEGRRKVRNPPADALVDVLLAEAIALSAKENRIVPLPHL